MYGRYAALTAGNGNAGHALHAASSLRFGWLRQYNFPGITTPEAFHALKFAPRRLLPTSVMESRRALADAATETKNPEVARDRRPATPKEKTAKTGSGPKSTSLAAVYCDPMRPAHLINNGGDLILKKMRLLGYDEAMA